MSESGGGEEEEAKGERDRETWRAGRFVCVMFALNILGDLNGS